MRKPLIGLVPLVDIGRESNWMLPGYMEGIEQAGGIPLMLSLTFDEGTLRQLAEELDGFVFTGGQDVSPSVYHKEVSDKCGELCPDRDEMEMILLRLAIKEDKPVLGICRGIQFINAALGGNLYQDLPSEHPSQVIHRQQPPYDRPSHTVRLVQDAPLAKLLGKEEISVNSCHHQAIKEISAQLQPMAYAEDGLIEAVWLPEARFVWAVQWHPEFSFRSSGESRQIFRHFIETVMAY